MSDKQQKAIYRFSIFSSKKQKSKPTMINTLNLCHGYQTHISLNLLKSQKSRERKCFCIYGNRERERDRSISSALRCSYSLKMMNVFDPYIVRNSFPSLFELLVLDIFSQNSKTSVPDASRLDNGGSDTDVIIVGAGVAGAALAHTLGKDGRRVRVIERDLTEPDRIVGELLMPGGYLKLIELGLEDCVEKIDAQRVLGYAVFKDGKSIRMSYLENFSSDVSGRCFHNGRFVQRMRDKAAVLPNVWLEQGTVTSFIEENGTIKGVRYKIKNGLDLEAYAPLTIVCDGCFSKLRYSLCNSKVDVPSCSVGLVLENCNLPYANYGHVIISDPSSIALYPISSTQIRCMVDVPGKKLPSILNGEMASYLKTVVTPQIPPELRDAFISAINKGNIRTMPNRCMPANPRPTPGAMLLGDAFNMRHSLTGLGMTMALSDIVVLRDLLRPLQNLNDASSLCKYLESFYTLREPVAFIINTMTAVLYKVFSAYPDQTRMELRQACFDSLSLGGIFLTVPMGLLSGLDPNPWTLALYFYAMALYAVGRLQLPFPSIKGTWDGARLISCACDMVFPIIEAEVVGKMFVPVTVPASLDDENNT